MNFAFFRLHIKRGSINSHVYITETCLRYNFIENFKIYSINPVLHVRMDTF